MTLAAAKRFRVPLGILEATEEALADAGADGHELFVLWSGKLNGKTFDVSTRHVPRQTSYRTKSGLLVRVDGDELHKLNVWLYDAGETLGVQIHAHPSRAYHSDTDDTYPIVSTPGALSIVAPDFCGRGLLVRDAAMYRLVDAGWKRQPRRVVEVM